jgi:hypothetical protein
MFGPIALAMAAAAGALSLPGALRPMLQPPENDVAKSTRKRGCSPAQVRRAAKKARNVQRNRAAHRGAARR